MRVIIFVLICVGAQAQSKPEIVALSDFGTSWMWKSQPGLVSDTKWELNQKQSKLIWMGKPIVGSGHEGTIQFTSGSIVTSSTGQITQGELVADMNTIKNTDMKPDDGGRDLEDHLKNDDFFSVTKFPRANFSILKVVPDATYKTSGRIKITGLLTIKGITNQVEFMATTTSSKENIQVKGELIIDRTKWDIIYQSKSIFKNLKDGVISDEIKLTLDLKFFLGC
ncbi:MAG: YceI family protein [Cyclobacteriaceae bacterium]|nr:MAG: YceI family protein [Cyclobacteriaceae bacterium]